MSDSQWRGGLTVGAIGVLAILVGSIGVADASNGGSLTLGHKNSATKTTTLQDNNSTPLSLVGPKSKAPLTVNSSKVVKHLDADLLDGVPAAQLRTGVSGLSARSLGTVISTNPASATLLVSTATLPPGSYLVEGSSELDTAGNSTGARCFLGANGDVNSADAFTPFGAVASGNGNAVETQFFTVTTPETIGLLCYTHDTSATDYGATIDAIHLTSFALGSAPGARAAVRSDARMASPGR